MKFFHKILFTTRKGTNFFRMNISRRSSHTSRNERVHLEARSQGIDAPTEATRNTSSRLLESFRSKTVTDEDVCYIQKYTTVYLE